MQTEDARVSDTAFAERRRETGANAPPIAADGPCDTYDEVLTRKKAYDAAFAEMERQLTALWGRAEAYTPCKEDEASLLQTFYYGWVQGTILLASKENLSREVLPPPTADVRTDESGRVLSRALQAALYKRNAWGALVGARVVSRLDAASSGVLRWVGVPQQGGYTRVMAAVEWDVAPAPRVAARSECAECSPFFNGTVHGEHLFEPTRPDMCTLEEVGSIDFVLAPRTSELGRTIPEPRRLSTTRSLFTALPSYFYWQFPYKATGDLCTLVIPVLLEQFVRYLDSDEPQTWSHGLWIVLSLFVFQALQSCALHRFYYVSIKGGCQYRGALTAAVFEKCFTIANKSLAKPDINPGRIINMVSTDTERVNDFVQYCMYLWSSPMVFVISIALLGRLVGWSCLMAVVAMAATLPINGFLMKKMMTARQNLVKATDGRVKATNEFLSGIRIAKFMTWEPRFIANIEAKRATEIHYLKQVQTARILQSFLNIATPMVMIAVVFVLYFSIYRELTPAIVYPTISLLGIIRMPFMMIPFVLSATVQYFVSITRINNFLECDNTSCTSVEDIERFFPPTEGHSLSCQLAGVFEHTDITAFIPVRLPVAPKVRLTFVGRLLHRFGCEACAPPGKRPAPTAVVEDEEGGGSAVTPPAGSPASPAEPKKAPGQAQPKDEFFQLEPKVLLRDLSVQIPAGKLTLVLGATGCGKSTLLNALLGQFEVSRGHVWATKSIAYVPQQPWIMNATVRNNILFFDEEDAGRLDAAIRVSQLETDLGLFAAGLETEIGEKGINLSGGQKARVSLARAVYADRDMYLLDDPLSALDAHVGERIVDDCFLGQLAGKTRVLATHQLHVVPKADYVIVLEDHSVAYHGAAAEFMRTERYSEMVAVTAAEKGDDAEAADAKHEGEGDAAEGAAVATLDDAASEDDTEPDAKTAAERAKEKQCEAKLMTTEEKASGAVPWATYVRYFEYCGGRLVAALGLVVFVVTEALTVSSTVWLSMWSTKRFALTDMQYLWGYIGLVLCGTATSPLRFSFGFRAMRRGAVNMHRAMLRALSAGTMEFFDTTPLGRILNRFSRDVDVADNNLQFSMIQLMNCFMTICSSVIITVSSQPFVIIALIPCGILYYKLMVFYNAANREIRRTSSIVKSPLFSLLGEVISGVSTIAAYGRNSVIMREAIKRLDVVFSCSLLENAANRWLGVRVELLSNVVVTVIAFVAVFGATTKAFGGDIGLVSLSLTMALQTTSQLNWLVRQAASVEADMNSVERVIYYIETTPKEEMPELDAEADALERQANLVITNDKAEVTIEAGSPTTVSPHIVKAGSLEFRDVQMRYREGLPLVLRDVSFRIAPREKVGIVGRTGSGKSTLLLTFMRMVDICGGEIVVSGQPIRSYPLRELRKQFSMIPQDPVLFDGTVRLNVDPFLEASSAEVWDALELVGLRERIASEPEGIDGRVLEGGSNFSVGQRQLLCMARALLKKGSGFILMDEATANIDQSLDRHIQGTVMKAFSAYTVITIAHRLQTVAQYDKIIVMDHGVVAEMGSPRELVLNPNSVFLSMVNSMGKSEAARFLSLVKEQRSLC